MSSVIVTDNSLTAWSSHTCSNVCGVGVLVGVFALASGLMVVHVFGCVWLWGGGWCFLAGSDAGCDWLVCSGWLCMADWMALWGCVVGCVACAFGCAHFFGASHASQFFVESLILAQDERWRRA